MMITKDMIKFRVWTGKTMLYDNFLIDWTGKIILLDERGYITGFLEEDYRVNYFTRFYTDNGHQPIYCGDIVRCKEKDFCWSAGWSAGKETEIITLVNLRLTSNIHTKNSGEPDGWTEYKEIEVLGNMYEHPELLKRLTR